MAALPTSTRVVIIGGGIVGCSTLFHLCEAGWNDCLLLEMNELTSGSTWHAAGNCPNFSTSWSIMKMQNYSNRLFGRLGELADYPINYHVTGAVRLAHSKQRMQEFEHVCSMAQRMGVDFKMLTPSEMQAFYPFLETHDLLGGCWDPGDGDIDPAQATQALAKAARDRGARIQRFCPVTGVRRDGDDWVIETPQGEVRCEFVVNAAGYRAHLVGAMFGRQVPCVSLAHQYLVSEEIPELKAREAKLPILRDPDASYYLRQEGNGLLLGPYEQDCRAHWLHEDDPMPDDFSFQLFPDDLDRLEPYIEDACARVPILGLAGITRVVAGPIPYAPDGNPLIGPMPGVAKAFEACVFTFGIVQGGAAGKICAEWIVEGETDGDTWSVDPRRFTDFATPEYNLAKAIEIYSHEYAMHFPKISWPVGRPGRASPIYDTLKAKGAEFGAYGGWERADWFARPGDQRGPASSYDFQHWHDAVGEECHHVAAHVGVLDLPGFTRFEVTSTGAEMWLRSLVTGGIAGIGRIGLIYFATPKGKVLTEMTVTRFTENHFWLMTSAAAAWHDRDWLKQNLPDEGGVGIREVSADWSTFVITGPKSRAVMAALCGNDFSTGAFRWLSHQPIRIGEIAGHALRVSYAGELGWEVHVPVADSAATYERICAAGADHHIRDFGMFALESMRLEKGYRSWKGDLSNDYSMFEAGLGRWVNLKKPEFIGRQALLAEANKAPAESFVTLTVEAGEGDPLYLSQVFAADKSVGLVLSAGYGHRSGTSIALCSVATEHAEPGSELEIDVLGQRRRAKVSTNAALYDPGNERLSQ